MRKIFLTVFFILFLVSPATVKAGESCSTLPSDRVIGNSFELICTGLNSQKQYRLLLDDSETCHSDVITISEPQLSPDNNGRLSKNITTWVTRSGTIHIKLYEQVIKNTCDLWKDQPIFSLESTGIAPTPTPTRIPTPTKGPCAKDDRICKTDNDCADLANPDQCQNYHCVLTPVGDELGSMVNACQFKPGFIAPTPTPTPVLLPPPCAPDATDSAGKCTKIKTGFGIDISTDPVGLIKSIFGIILSLSGGIAVILIIFSGYKLMMSQGDPEKIKGARETLTSAIVGLLFIIFSLAILQLIGFDILKIPGFEK